MNKVVELSKSLGRFVADNSPNILTGVAVAGVLSTVILAVKATPAAMRRIELEFGDVEGPIPRKDVIFLVWKDYVPAAATGAVTIACIIGATRVNNRRNAALISAYSLTETAFKEYREKVIENVGATKEQKVRDDIAQDRVLANPVDNKEIIITQQGEVLCYDSLTGRYFNSSVESIRKAQNDINALCLTEMYASQNDFYRKIGLPPTVYGEEMGWRVDHQMDIHFSATLADDNRPCLSLEYRVQPIRGYYKNLGR